MKSSVVWQDYCGRWLARHGDVIGPDFETNAAAWAWLDRQAGESAPPLPRGRRALYARTKKEKTMAMKRLITVGAAGQVCDTCLFREAKTIEPTDRGFALVCDTCPLPTWVPLGVAAASALASIDPTNPKTSDSAAKYRKPINLGAESEMKMNINNVYPGRWLKAADLAGKPAVLKIAAADMEELQSPDGSRQTKLVLRFADEPKSLVVNKTNLYNISEFLGAETDDWVGHPIEVYPDRTDLGGKRVACVRVRAPGG